MHGIDSISILYIPFILILISFTVSSFRLQYIDIQKRASRVLLEITLVNVFYYTSLCVTNYDLIRVLFTLIFILAPLLAIEIFWYIVKLTEFNKYDIPVNRFISWIVLIAVVLLEIPNFFTIWGFSLLRFKYDGQHYYTFGIRPAHIFIIGVLVCYYLATMYLCAKKAIQVSSVYRRRYLYFLATYFIVLFMEQYFEFSVRTKTINLTYAFFSLIAFEMYWDCYKSAHQYRSFIDHFMVDKLEVGLIMFNYSDTLESYNRRSAEWFQLTEPMHGKLSRTKFIVDNQIPVSEELVNQEFRFQFRDEFLDGRMEVIIEEEKITGVFFVFYNITKEVEARTNLEKYSKNRNDFVQNMTHELRTPLNAVIGFSDQLMDNMPSGEYKEQVGCIDKSGKLILRYIDEMTDMMSLSDGLYTITNKDFNSADEFSLISEKASNAENNTKVSFETTIDPMTPSVLHGDINSIGIVLDNVINNAFKYTERGRISISYKWNQETVGKGNIEVSVNDSGCGMSEEVLENIYLAFSVGADIQHKHENGIGIGLFITKKILDLLGGTISVESHQNIGTKVTVKIPLEVVDPTPVSTSERRASLRNVTLKLDDVNIMVVEDNILNARSIKRQLEYFKGNVTVCYSGEAALEMLASNSNFDIIFMDYVMPGMDGIETTKRIRSSGVAVRKIPIIAVTADVSPKRKEQFHQAKMNDVLFKPFELIELMDTLARWLPPKKVILSQKDEEKRA